MSDTPAERCPVSGAEARHCYICRHDEDISPHHAHDECVGALLMIFEAAYEHGEDKPVILTGKDTSKFTISNHTKYPMQAIRAFHSRRQ